MLSLISGRTIWHITFGTYGCRLHGADEPTVDRQHNQPGTPFLAPDPCRRRDEAQAMRGHGVHLSAGQRTAIEATIPTLCQRGRWDYLVCAAPGPPDDDHAHVLLAADPAVHGKTVRQWLKRWLTEELDAQWPRPMGGAWWAVGGSTKPVNDEQYLRNVYRYIGAQRSTPWIDRLPGT